MEVDESPGIAPPESNTCEQPNPRPKKKHKPTNRVSNSIYQSNHQTTNKLMHKIKSCYEVFAHFSMTCAMSRGQNGGTSAPFADCFLPRFPRDFCRDSLEWDPIDASSSSSTCQRSLKGQGSVAPTTLYTVYIRILVLLHMFFPSLKKKKHVERWCFTTHQLQQIVVFFLAPIFEVVIRRKNMWDYYFKAFF